MYEQKIYIIGSIDDVSFKEFSEELSRIENAYSLKDMKKLTVEIEMNSHGGTAIDALAFYSRIRTSPITINITVYGYVASAAVLVFAGCKKRRMAKEAWMMVHEDSDSLKNVMTTVFKKHSDQMQRFENQWSFLLAQHSSTSAEEWLKLHKETTYLNSGQCVDLGIVDEIV